jgi:hypothetical protein
MRPSVQSLRECECAERKHTFANLDPCANLIEICSDAQDLKRISLSFLFSQHVPS